MDFAENKECFGTWRDYWEKMGIDECSKCKFEWQCRYRYYDERY